MGMEPFVMCCSIVVYDDDGERHLGSRKNQFHSLPVRRDHDTDDRSPLGYEIQNSSGMVRSYVFLYRTEEYFT